MVCIYYRKDQYTDNLLFCLWCPVCFYFLGSQMPEMGNDFLFFSTDFVYSVRTSFCDSEMIEKIVFTFLFYLYPREETQHVDFSDGRIPLRYW
jgi:hypothetical protein